MPFSFKRPENLSFPQIYYKFQAKDRDSDEIVDYYVQDLPTELYERAIELMVTDFLPDETMGTAQNVQEILKTKPESVEEFRSVWRVFANEKLSLACFKSGSNELVAVNFLLVNSKDDIKDEYKWHEIIWKNLFECIEIEMKKANTFEKFNVDRYLSAYGLCINKAYRRRGIATEMLKARVPYMKLFGLKVTSTAFTGIGSQKAAALADYKEIYVRSYADIEKEYPTFDFSKTPTTKDFKMMALEI